MNRPHTDDTPEHTTPQASRLARTPSGQEPGPRWRPDHLPGFEQATLASRSEGRSPRPLTVVRPQHRHPNPARRRPVLAVHGWSDYFYNHELAEAAEAAGYAFHAVDLPGYGRSLRPGQTPGWTDDLRRYDTDLETALAAVAREHPLPPVLLGHSTGGLVAALWADAHPGRAEAIVLNSPWLQTHGGTPVRTVLQPLLRPLARRHPHAALQLPFDHYWRSLSAEADGEWDLHPDWRGRRAFPVPAAWLDAVLEGHRAVAHGLDVDAPVLVLASRAGHAGLRYSEAMQAADIVLNPDVVAERALRLGDRVTVHRHDGALHDVFASAEPVRRAALAETLRWLRAYAPPAGPSDPVPAPEVPDAEGAAGTD
ncbi:alpha/beta hydrolase [Micrococcus sp.]|uniref:alpha/beta hydrolase n=1 Tax=Micrococcus sp. TaxID=1271 RepID=UPI002A915E54|nr:alpha/beta hydrolase [Micrococcus sp.]MDY6055429.1 alpha/beta hydrolase [Micrococcus sp.]